MADKTNSIPFVITCTDEGVQINEGIRLGFAGAGFELEGFTEAVAVLKKILKADLYLAASSECAWIKQELNLDEWEEVDAMTQQHLQSLADREKIKYAGFLPFADPQELNYGVKGHMVRPHGVHLANKICFTFGGGEQTYNLGQFLISADWVSEADEKLVEKCIKKQVDFFQGLSKSNLKFVCQMKGVLGEEVAKKNQAVLKKLGYEMEIVD